MPAIAAAKNDAGQNQRRPAPEAEGRDGYQLPAAADLKFPHREGKSTRERVA